MQSITTRQHKISVGPITRYSGETHDEPSESASKRDAAEAEAGRVPRELAKWPHMAHESWKSLPESEQVVVLLYITVMQPSAKSQKSFHAKKRERFLPLVEITKQHRLPRIPALGM